MSAKKKDSKREWIDPDDAPEWSADVFDRAQISVGGKVIREATGTLTKRGRPPIGNKPKEQVTLRLPAEVIAYFKADGPGWQTRVGEVLERYTAKDKRKHAETH
jgi:uncharacterized protein (DUF4415 family)